MTRLPVAKDSVAMGKMACGRCGARAEAIVSQPSSGGGYEVVKVCLEHFKSLRPLTDPDDRSGIEEGDAGTKRQALNRGQPLTGTISTPASPGASRRVVIRSSIRRPLLKPPSESAATTEGVPTAHSEASARRDHTQTLKVKT